MDFALLALLGLAVTVMIGAAIAVVAWHRAPDGFEDANGFHAVRPVAVQGFPHSAHTAKCDGLGNVA